MHFREFNYRKDLSETINLINNNLDPEMTEDFFSWKHVENPFGRSYGLVASDKNKIVGLRMFMFWEFHNSQLGRNIKALRPVDTVTDMKYRGKGLFKQLTLKGIEECKGMYDMIFNTPNEKSRNGYLKMGWNIYEDIGNFKVGITNIFGSSMHPKFLENFPENFFLNSEGAKAFQTRKTPQFLSWRYSIPQYSWAAFEEEGCYMVFKKTFWRGLPLLMIFEILGDKQYFQQMICGVCKKLGTPLVYYFNSEELKNVTFAKSFSRSKPVVVLKGTDLLAPLKLNFSLGDLEGKL